MAAAESPHMHVVSLTALGPFGWRWPEGMERFEHGWAALVETPAGEVHVRHGVNQRDTFGRSRRHSVTWIENDPTVEGVGADDYEKSGALLSLIKVTKKHLRPDGPTPDSYADFEIVVMAEAARGPYSPRSLAVKLKEDDIEGWVRHAVLRATAWGRLGPRLRDRPSLPPLTSAGPATVEGAVQAPAEGRQAVVKALLAYAATHPKPPEGEAVNFTPLPAANELLKDTPFAFLCAVIFDQGVPAERAWRAPYELLQRLGHLDPKRIAEEPEAVAAAIQAEPKRGCPERCGISVTAPLLFRQRCERMSCV